MSRAHCLIICESKASRMLTAVFACFHCVTWGGENHRNTVKIIVARRSAAVFAFPAVRGWGGSAGETRQVLIEATVICPCLPRIPWQHFLTTVTFDHKFVVLADQLLDLENILILGK